MKALRFYTFLASIFLGSVVPAQTESVLNLSAPDSCAFLLSVNDQSANSLYSSSITLHGLSAGKTSLIVRFMNPQLTEIKSTVTLKSGMRHNFYVQPGTAGLKVIALDESPVRLYNFASADSLEIDKPTMSYSGITGCSTPIDDTDFDNLMGDVHDTSFQNAKLSLLLQIVRNNCLETTQLAQAIGVLDLEEHRLQVVENSVGHIFDLGRSASLESLFFLESSKQKLRSLLATQ